MSTAQAAVLAERPRSGGFFGHPKGLAYLAFTEMWERFSYYGMTSLLALYMTKQLLLAGHAEHVAGLASLRHLFEARGPMSDVAFASLIYGWYGGLVYFTPVLGGLIADRWLGTRATVVLGALLMSAGHLAMSFDQSFLIALLMLIAGSGCLKGNISAQVGQLYPAHEETMRTGGFTIFSAAINIGAVLGPLGCGTVAAIYGWHAGLRTGSRTYDPSAGNLSFRPAAPAWQSFCDQTPGRKPPTADPRRAPARRLSRDRHLADRGAERRLPDDLEHWHPLH